MKFEPPQFEMSESGKEFQKALAEQFSKFYDIIDRLRAERDEARREVSFLRPSVCLGAQTAHEYAQSRDWDCFKNAPVVKTLNGVVVSKGKALPPKFDLEEDGK